MKLTTLIALVLITLPAAVLPFVGRPQPNRGARAHHKGSIS